MDRIYKNICTRSLRHPSAAGTNSSLLHSAVAKIFDLMNVNKDSVFVDLGAGFGLPAFHAVLLRGIQETHNYERGEYEVAFCRTEASRLDKADCFTFHHMDIMDIESLPENSTHIFTF